MSRKNTAKGFTIVELLIATVVFSIVLLIITTGVLQFSRQYYRGVVSSQTQNAARGLMDTITHDIQFNPGGVSELRRVSLAAPYNPANPIVGYCIGGAQRYSFVLNTEVTSAGSFGTHQGAHALVADTTSGCTTTTAALNAGNTAVLTTNDPNTGSLPINARETLGEHMRLVKFSVASAPGIANAYSVTVRIVYGDDDVLCSPTAGTCNQNTYAASTLNGRDDIQCKPVVGNQFCAVAEYTTTVKKRVN